MALIAPGLLLTRSPALQFPCREVWGGLGCSFTWAPPLEEEGAGDEGSSPHGPVLQASFPFALPGQRGLHASTAGRYLPTARHRAALLAAGQGKMLALCSVPARAQREHKLSTHRTLCAQPLRAPRGACSKERLCEQQKGKEKALPFPPKIMQQQVRAVSAR